LEDLTPGTRVRGLLPDRPVTVVHADWHGMQVITLTYRDDGGVVGNQLLCRDDEARLRLEAAAAAFAFDGDGTLFRLASEAMRIRLAYLFDPMPAVNIWSRSRRNSTVLGATPLITKEGLDLRRCWSRDL
jgi:hypothetical protein